MGSGAAFLVNLVVVEAPPILILCIMAMVLLRASLCLAPFASLWLPLRVLHLSLASLVDAHGHGLKGSWRDGRVVLHLVLRGVCAVPPPSPPPSLPQIAK